MCQQLSNVCLCKFLSIHEFVFSNLHNFLYFPIVVVESGQATPQIDLNLKIALVLKNALKFDRLFYIDYKAHNTMKSCTTATAFPAICLRLDRATCNFLRARKPNQVVTPWPGMKYKANTKGLVR